MRKLSITLALVAALAVAAFAIPAFAATKTVKVGDEFFSPKTLTVKKGTTLKFVWIGDEPHNVTGAGIKIGTRTSGTKTAKARRSGTIVCTIHPKMKLKLRVR